MSIGGRSLGGAKKVAGLYTPSAWKAHGWLWRIVLVVMTLVVIIAVLMFWWSREPSLFSVEEASQAYLAEGQTPVVGSAMVGSTVKIIDVLLNKSGGYIRNDVTPPGILMDNIPEWEYGVLKQLREVSYAMRNEFSRSQSQSAQVRELEVAENNLRHSSTQWMLPRTEGKYAEAQALFQTYGQEIADDDTSNAQFYARADNLASYLDMVSKTMGDLTQRLSASVGDVVVDIDAASTDVAQSSAAPAETEHRTSWWEIDNIFYETRGYSWALLHELKAARVDFEDTLRKKNALASLDQIINELEKTQKTVWSPMILNGRGFGFSANHSLVMASYISRANAAIIDLSQLLRDG